MCIEIWQNFQLRVCTRAKIYEFKIHESLFGNESVFQWGQKFDPIEIRIGILADRILMITADRLPMLIGRRTHYMFHS